MSLARQNFSREAEEALNRQINVELSASYAYLSMATYLARDTVALHGMAKHFKDRSKEEYDHAQEFIDYLTKRGGKVEFATIPAPEVEWKSAINILEATLKMEKDVNQSLLNLSAIASRNEDPEMEEFISGKFLHEQVDDIKKVADLIAQLNLAGSTGLGLYIFDKQFQDSH